MSDDSKIAPPDVGGRRFSTAKSVEVDQLQQMYDSVFTDVDAALGDAKISTQLQVPEIPDGLDAILLFGPAGDPFPPEDITNLDSLQIGKLFTYMHNWANYVQAESTRAKSRVDVEAEKLKIVKSALRLYYKKGDKKVAASDVDDYVNVDPRMVQLNVGFEKLQAYYKAVEGRYEQLKRSLNNISREQTRRAEELERSLHAEGKSTMSARPGGFRR